MSPERIVDFRITVLSALKWEVGAKCRFDCKWKMSKPFFAKTKSESQLHRGFSSGRSWVTSLGLYRQESLAGVILPLHRGCTESWKARPELGIPSQPLVTLELGSVAAPDGNLLTVGAQDPHVFNLLRAIYSCLRYTSLLLHVSTIFPFNNVVEHSISVAFRVERSQQPVACLELVSWVLLSIYCIYNDLTINFLCTFAIYHYCTTSVQEGKNKSWATKKQTWKTIPYLEGTPFSPSLQLSVHGVRFMARPRAVLYHPVGKRWPWEVCSLECLRGYPCKRKISS